MAEEPKKIDRRVLKTKKAIHNAFAQLLSEKNLSDITIKDIADRADINRKTFYNYYSGVYQVVDEIENEIVSLFESTLKTVDFSVAMRQPSLIFGRLTDIISSDLEFYGHLLRSDRDTSLTTKIAQAVMKAAKRSLAPQLALDDETLDIATRYVVSGMLSVYQDWFRTGRHQSIEELSKLVGQLCFYGLNGILQEPSAKK